MDKKLLDILVCPITHEKLRLEGDWLVGERTGVKYPIREGVPILLPDEAVLPEGVASVDELEAAARKKP